MKFKSPSHAAAIGASAALILLAGFAFCAPSGPVPVRTRALARFEVIKFSNNLTGRQETGLLRLDKETGRTWVYEDADVHNAYVAVWVQVNESAYSTADFVNTNLASHLAGLGASSPASSVASP